MDLEQLREFGTLVENLGNPNDLVREKHTAELLRTIQSNQVQSMLLSIGLVFSSRQLIKALLSLYRRKRRQSSLPISPETSLLKYWIRRKLSRQWRKC